ncbi:MAG TPA: hypothetical protein VFG86_09520 [Chloroflexota bacterium]|jgi:predicted nuclease with RNAse H fold|nr:hypothetical protein [Chloroflexota bacterium]
MLDHLLTLGPRIVIGLDFAFSFPSWYLEQLRVDSAPALWSHVAQHGERWLQECAPPFWGRPGHRRPVHFEHFRRTEHALRRRGLSPKSVFQIGGAGAVGTGSIRGMPLLHALRARGASIWPFDPPGWPRVVEIYPRLLTGPVVKSSAAARQAYLDRHLPAFQHAVPSEDAFDAAVSALTMARHAADLESLLGEPDFELRREGRIWYPNWRADLT